MLSHTEPAVKPDLSLPSPPSTPLCRPAFIPASRPLCPSLAHVLTHPQTSLSLPCCLEWPSFSSQLSFKAKLTFPSKAGSDLALP